MLAFDDWIGGGGGGAGYGFDAWMADRQAYLLSGGYRGDNMSFDLGNIDFGQIGEDVQTVADIFDSGGGYGSERDRAVNLVNSAEVVFQQNLADYKAGNISASVAAERFDKVWTQLVTQLQPLGSEGARAIADRQGGGKYDWFAAYRPAGVSLTTGTPQTGSVITGVTTSGFITGGKLNMQMLLVAGIIGFGIWYAAKQGAFK